MGFLKSKEFFRLGENDVFSIVHFLYYMGFPIILFKAFQFGKAIKLQSIVNKVGMGNVNIDPSNFNMYGITWFDSFKGFIGGIIYFVVIIIIWKLICELIFVLFKFFESNTRKE
ncbi:hypothetical protein [Candidatus Clostridium stratigraminis]|uniref:Uncharacterized protein n=1 Tax=Candidatus Clostridium stratigraminis TaxID=3381661 RepID=A0ABW8T431_9CLOT